MKGSHIAGGAGWGALAGALLGLLDAWTARGVTLAPEPSLWLTAVLIDGVLLALVGGVLGAVARRDLPGAAPAGAVALGLVLATGVRTMTSPSVAPPGPPPAHALVWIAPTPWSSDVASVGERVAALAEGAAVFERVVAASPRPDASLAAALTGRWTEGRRDDGPTVLAEADRQGAVSGMVLRDEPSQRDLASAAERVGLVRGAGPFGLGPAASHLFLPSLAAEPAAPGPEAWTRALDEALGGAGDHALVVVRVDAADLPEVDAIVGTLVARARERVDEVTVVVGGLVGDASAPGSALGPRATTAPLLVLAADGEGAGTQVTDQVRSVDLAPSLLDLAGLRVVDVWDGFSLRPRVGLAVQLARAAVPPVEIGEDDEVVRLDDTPVRCDTEHLSTRDLPARTLGADGAEVVRRGGYALVVSGDERSLHDEVEDPLWERDLLDDDGATLCDGTPAAEAAEALEAASATLVDESVAGRERALPDDEAGEADLDFPDPLAPLPEAG